MGAVTENQAKTRTKLGGPGDLAEDTSCQCKDCTGSSSEQSRIEEHGAFWILLTPVMDSIQFVQHIQLCYDSISLKILLLTCCSSVVFEMSTSGDFEKPVRRN